MDKAFKNQVVNKVAEQRCAHERQCSKKGEDLLPGRRARPEAQVVPGRAADRRRPEGFGRKAGPNRTTYSSGI